MNTNTPEKETGVEPLNENERKKAEPAIRLALVLAEWLRIRLRMRRA